MKSHKMSFLETPVELASGDQLIGLTLPKGASPAKQSATRLARSSRKNMALLGSKEKLSAGEADDGPRSPPWDAHALDIRRNRAGCIWKFDRRQQVEGPPQEL